MKVYIVEASEGGWNGSCSTWIEGVYRTQAKAGARINFLIPKDPAIFYAIKEWKVIE